MAEINPLKQALIHYEPSSEKVEKIKELLGILSFRQARAIDPADDVYLGMILDELGGGTIHIRANEALLDKSPDASETTVPSILNLRGRSLDDVATCPVLEIVILKNNGKVTYCLPLTAVGYATLLTKGTKPYSAATMLNDKEAIDHLLKEVAWFS